MTELNPSTDFPMTSTPTRSSTWISAVLLILVLAAMVAVAVGVLAGTVAFTQPIVDSQPVAPALSRIDDYGLRHPYVPTTTSSQPQSAVDDYGLPSADALNTERAASLDDYGLRHPRR